MTNKRGLQGLLWLACLFSGPAVWAMPVLMSSGQESGELSAMSALTSFSASATPPHKAHAGAGLPLTSAPAAALPIQLHSLSEASSVAPMNDLLVESSRQAQAAAAESVLGASAVQQRREQDSGRELFRSGVKELEIVADVKLILQGVRSELHQVTGANLASLHDDRAAELASLNRRIEERQNKRHGEGSGYGRDRSDAELRDDSIRASLMLSQLIDEITPWAIGVAVVLALYHATRAMLRLQAARQLKAVQETQQTALGSPRSSSLSLGTATRMGGRRSERGSSRSGRLSGGRSRRRWF